MALSDKKALIIATSYGVERDELLVPRDHLRDEGVAVTVATVDGDDVQTLVGDKDPGSTVAADAAIADGDVDYELTVRGRDAGRCVDNLGRQIDRLFGMRRISNDIIQSEAA